LNRNSLQSSNANRGVIARDARCSAQILGEYVRQLAPAPAPRTVAQEVADLLR
jgi:hypothetical protein